MEVQPRSTASFSGLHHAFGVYPTGAGSRVTLAGLFSFIHQMTTRSTLLIRDQKTCLAQGETQPCHPPQPIAHPATFALPWP